MMELMLDGLLFTIGLLQLSLVQGPMNNMSLK
jgi:hypothetical protein